MKGKIVSLYLVTILLCSGSTVQAEDLNRKNALISTGDISLVTEETSLTLDSLDLYTLSDYIDNLEQKYDSGLKVALSQIGTNITSENPTYEELINGIILSQEIRTKGKVVYKTYQGGLTDNTSETPVEITGAIADNLSVGTACWVEGEYIEGTGADNLYYYNLGYTDGKSDLPNASVSYTYHKHSGDSTNGSGCYTKAVYHSHGSGCYSEGAHSSSCYKEGNHTDSCEKHWGRHEYPCGFPSHDGNGDGVCDGFWIYDCGGHSYLACSGHKTLTCNISTTKVQGYKLNCGKTTDTIESATIVYN